MRTRIAVLGANGQVGAELCLLLSRQAGVDVVPICRNRQGSAYLRWRGLACRHGRIDSEASARALIADCAAIANLVLIATASDPRGARAANDRMLASIARAAAPGARHVYFSTMSVYGDREVGQRFAPRNAYAQEKRRCETVALREGRRAGLETIVFRLGHVAGELQRISEQMATLLARGPVLLPDPSRDSNTTQVAAICDALLKAASGAIPPGTYDLMNTPQWNWRQAFEHESQLRGRVLSIRTVADRRPASMTARLRRAAGGLLLGMARSTALRRWLGRATPLLPAPLFGRLKARYATRAAGADVAALASRPDVLEAARRTPIPVRAAPGLALTAELLARPEYRVADLPTGVWPDDLPAADAAGIPA